MLLTIIECSVNKNKIFNLFHHNRFIILYNSKSDSVPNNFFLMCICVKLLFGFRRTKMEFACLAGANFLK